MYPAALTAFGLVGNAYILGNQIKDLRDDLGGQIKGVNDGLGGQILEVKDDVKEVKHDIKRLIARQTQMELRNRSVEEKLLRDCGKNK